MPNDTKKEWQTRPLNVSKWRMFSARWFQLIIVDKLGKERKFIMREVQEFKGEKDEEETL